MYATIIIRMKNKRVSKSAVVNQSIDIWAGNKPAGFAVKALLCYCATVLAELLGYSLDRPSILHSINHILVMRGLLTGPSLLASALLLIRSSAFHHCIPSRLQHRRLSSLQVTSDIKSEVSPESTSTYPSKDELQHILNGNVYGVSISSSLFLHTF